MKRVLRLPLILLLAGACGADDPSTNGNGTGTGNPPGGVAPGGNGPTGGGTVGGGGQTPAPMAKQANTIRGRVLDERGNPIAVPGAKIQISVNGVSAKSGEKVHYAPGVLADGSYSLPLVDGIYHPPSAVEPGVTGERAAELIQAVLRKEELL